jgi:hypothetical protein
LRREVLVAGFSFGDLPAVFSVGTAAAMINDEAGECLACLRRRFESMGVDLLGEMVRAHGPKALMCTAVDSLCEVPYGQSGTERVKSS